jgi:hypothetical protein
MSNRPIHRLTTGVLIVLLHLPLMYYARSLYSALAPGQGLGDLDTVSLLVLTGLVALPYAALAITGIRWNPERARLNEYGA